MPLSTGVLRRDRPGNDEVKDGFSERGGHPVERKKPTNEPVHHRLCRRLLNGLDTIPEANP